MKKRIESAFIDNAMPGTAPAIDQAVVARAMAGAIDSAVIDSTGAFFATALHQIDPILNLPLAMFNWQDAVDIIPLDIATEVTTFDSMKVLANGGVNPTKKSWVSGKTTEVGTVGIDLKRNSSPTALWAESVKRTTVELAQAMLLNRPLDAMLLDALNFKKNIDLQNQVFTGDTELGVYGLLNNVTYVTPSSVAQNVAANSYLWVNKSDDEIIADINGILSAVQAASGYALIPDTIGLPPAKLNYLITRKCGANASRSIMDYIMENNIGLKVYGKQIKFQPFRELINCGAGGSIDRMIAYVNNRECVRIPLSPMLSLPPQFVGMYQNVIYYMRFGCVEMKRPEGIAYRDGF